MDKIKIAFDPNASKYQDYKELIVHIFNDLSESIELYSISKVSSIKLVEIDDDNIFVLSTNSDIIDKISTLNISIYLSSDKELCSLINDTIPIMLNGVNTGCEAIVVDDGMMNAYKVKKRYVESLDFWTNQIAKSKSHG